MRRPLTRDWLLAAVLLCTGGQPFFTSAVTQTVDADRLATLAVQPARVPRETAFDGVTEAVNKSTVAAQTSGRVMELPYDVGDYVEKDAVIVRFSETEQRARPQALEAAAAKTEARQDEARLAYDRTRSNLSVGQARPPQSLDDSLQSF